MRKRSEPHTFQQRLLEQKSRLERELAAMPQGERRDQLAARIEQLESAAEMHDFLTSREDAAARR